MQDVANRKHWEGVESRSVGTHGLLLTFSTNTYKTFSDCSFLLLLAKRRGTRGISSLSGGCICTLCGDGVDSTTGPPGGSEDLL